MPISTIASYLSTIDEFVIHWTQVNTSLGAGGPLVLTGSFAVANLSTLKTNLQTAITAVEGPRNDKQNAATDRDLKKGPLLERLRQFRGIVIGQLAGSAYAKSAPTIPSFTASEGVFMRAMDDMQSLWVKINAAPPAGFTGPLKCAGNYLVATHATDVAALRTTYTTLNNAIQTIGLRLGERDAQLPTIRTRLVQYRTVIPGIFAKGDALLLSLPRVTPPPGATPKAVNLSWVWNAGTEMADLSWSASDNPNLKEYQVRACDPPTYKAAEEVTVDTIAKTQTTFSTNEGLGVSGAVKLFKVYVVTEDDNEKGSKSVKVTVP